MSTTSDAVSEDTPQATLAQHIVGGFTTAVASSYALFAVPTVLHELLGVPYAGALTGTVLLACSMTFLMGWYARLPFVVVPSVGTCAVLATIVASQHVPWQAALAVSFWTGILFVAISFTSLRESIAVAIPKPVREAAVVGTGLLLIKAALTMEGFRILDILSSSAGQCEAALCLAGLVGVALVYPHSPVYALPFGIVSITIIGLCLGRVQLPPQLVSAPDFSTGAIHLDYAGALSFGMLPIILAIFCTDLVDSVAGFVSVSQSMGLMENDRPKNLDRGMLVDSLATLVAGLVGTVPGSTSLQSVVASESGSPSGTTAVCAALWFLPCLFLAPIAMIVPKAAIAATLIVVGAKLLKHASTMFDDAVTCRWAEFCTAAVTVIVIGFRGSLVDGVLFGATVWVIGSVARGCWKELSFFRCGFALLAFVYIVLEIVSA